jgi:hypothetical protein
LRQINERFPQDFDRLRERIVMMRLLPRTKFADGTRGEWLARDGRAVYPETDPTPPPPNVSAQIDECVCGILELPEVGLVTEDSLTGHTAHELGHACTLQADIARRQAPEDGWGSEAAADWYAYKWGFGRFIAGVRKTREFGHHGPGPGHIIHLDYSGHTFRLSRNFVYHLVK